MRTLTKTQDIQRTRREIEDSFARKERTEYNKVPDDKTGNKGERHLLNENSSDHIVVKTRNGWKVGQFVEYESNMPGNSVGRNGDIRVLFSDSQTSLLMKASGAWHVINVDAVQRASILDIVPIGTLGIGPTRLANYKTLGTFGAYQLGRY